MNKHSKNTEKDSSKDTKEDTIKPLLYKKEEINMYEKYKHRQRKDNFIMNAF